MCSDCCCFVSNISTNAAIVKQIVYLLRTRLRMTLHEADAEALPDFCKLMLNFIWIFREAQSQRECLCDLQNIKIFYSFRIGLGTADGGK